MTGNEAFDAIIVGGGHNGLAAAAYLSRAGQRVLVLERLGHAGGAAVSAQAFDGVDARRLCGSGARRGGAVSAIGGHNAAMAVLELAGGS